MSPLPLTSNSATQRQLTSVSDREVLDEELPQEYPRGRGREVPGLMDTIEKEAEVIVQTDSAWVWFLGLL